MPHKLELYSGNRAIVVNSITGHHFSQDPIPKARAEKQLRLLKSVEKEKDDPCWKGYKMYGTKKKGKRTVPNCVPIK